MALVLPRLAGGQAPGGAPGVPDSLPEQAQAGPAPDDWARPHLWTPGQLVCIALGKFTFDDPDKGRVTLDVSFWRDPLDPSGRYSAMVETW